MEWLRYFAPEPVIPLDVLLAEPPRLVDDGQYLFWLYGAGWFETEDGCFIPVIHNCAAMLAAVPPMSRA